MTGGQRPENRHDRYASRNAGDVHDGTGDQASSDVTLRQQPVSAPSNRRFPLSGCTRQVCLQQRAGRCSKTRGLRWPVLKADSTTTRHTRTDPAQRTLSGQERFPGMTISYVLLQTIKKMSEKPDKVRIITKARVRRRPGSLTR